MDQFNDRSIGKLAPPERGQEFVWDKQHRGLGLRITSAGAKSFVFRYVLNGRERKITLGNFPAWSIGRARRRASELRVQVDNGVDVRADTPGRGVGIWGSRRSSPGCHYRRAARRAFKANGLAVT